MALFVPAELLICIGEDRAPTANEVAVVADKIWHEALAHRRLDPRHAAAVARVALVGQPPAVRS
ncbi:hypothetical protein U1701_09285 [Sphingomonas sp. PB2P19]|uniref:hypothetical protein n=1 Tax=Sphingomonas rhamnosi TaxID=3096156 RepID=UPI002FC7CD0D